MLFVLLSYENVAVVPWSYSRRRRRRSLRQKPQSPHKSVVSIDVPFESTFLTTTLVGTEVASDPRQRPRMRKGALALFFELESEEATGGLSCGFVPFGFGFAA